MAARTLNFVRLGFPVILEAKPVMQGGRPIGDPRFGANLHIYDESVISPIKADIFTAWVEKWPDPARRPRMPVAPDSPKEAWKNQPGFCRIPLVWGPSEFPNDPNATGWVLISSARQDNPPTVVEIHNGVPVQLMDRTKVYPGCEAHVNVGIYGYQIQVNQPGISAGLNGVALTGRDLGRFDSRPTVGQMFGALPPEAPTPPAPPAPQTTGQVQPSAPLTYYSAPTAQAPVESGGYFDPFTAMTPVATPAAPPFNF